jgi:hypothetical protein
LAGFRYGVEPGDAFKLAGVAFVLLASAGLATLVPAWRALALSPLWPCAKDDVADGAKGLVAGQGCEPAALP